MKYKYDKNLDSYTKKLDTNYDRQDTIDKTYDRIHKTNWSSESDYYNTVRVNGKNTTRTLKFKK